MSGAGLNMQGLRFRDVGSRLQRLGFRVCFFEFTSIPRRSLGVLCICLGA